MKICAIICEFNPFHNGHKYLIEHAKSMSGCDKILCIMSGSFTQRGDICIMDKFTRARHAILCGADAVLELPVSFSVAPAEIFALGAIKILNSIPEISTLAFGCENADADFKGAAQVLSCESLHFKQILNQQLSKGESYIRSYQAAFEACGGQKDLLSCSNNILGIEYAKAVLHLNSNIGLLPIQRVGAQYNDGELKENYSSASAIRSNSTHPLIKNNLPECVFDDFKNFSDKINRYHELLRFSLMQSDSATLQNIYGCTEGLENRLLNFALLPFEQLIEQTTARRYSASRIKRILAANLLQLYKQDSQEYIAAKLYIKPLTIKKDGADEILSALAKSEYPLITKQRDFSCLDETAKKCFDGDERAYKLWKFIANSTESGFDYVKFI